ncbi:multiple coagulation factor deficiency protein 2 homolog [Galendromus occidentalis]|uniref:Multiple coagulation factor deficiency protein 2 homolog n=1 Tax=Galendromus occidentalis TaxID=34638 RepID=A0AAJ6QYQ9_9ACAR|nr:multiple coagulation factor deficiency protein 2 homolog [Galendromus occidentalis]
MRFTSSKILCAHIMLWFSIFSACIVGASTQTIKEFRRKYTADYIIRDSDHIREDLKYLIDVQSSGSMTDTEASFYVIKMHDFDDNNLLDGLELIQMVSHSATLHEDAGKITIDFITASVDAFLMYDENQDGFVSYAEWASSLLRTRARNRRN